MVRRFNMKKTFSSIFEKAVCKGSYGVVFEAYYLREWDGYDMQSHKHSRMEIMYIISGHCIVQVNDEKILLVKSEFICIDADVFHSLHVLSGAPCRIMNIEFTFEEKECSLAIKEIAEKYPVVQNFLSHQRQYFIYHDADDICWLLRKIISSVDNQMIGRELECDLLFAELLICMSCIDIEQTAITNPGHKYIQAAIRYMKHNYYRDISMSKISKHVGVTEGYLSRIFKTSTGESVMAYLSQIRVKKAMLLLSKTELPITDICAYIGIESRQYFDRVFKNQTELTPSEYRKKVVHPELVNYKTSE